MDSETTQPGPEQETPPRKRNYACNVCEDSGKVHMAFQGANGQTLREVPCPECDAGVHLAIGRDEAIKKLDERLQRIGWLVIIAIALAAAALMIREQKDGGHVHGSPWTEAVSEGAK